MGLQQHHHLLSFGSEDLAESVLLCAVPGLATRTRKHLHGNLDADCLRSVAKDMEKFGERLGLKCLDISHSTVLLVVVTITG